MISKLLKNDSGIDAHFSISHTTMLVLDQQEAVRFYTQKLGFKVHKENSYRTIDWVTLFLDESGVELAQILAVSPEEKALVGKQMAMLPFMICRTANFQLSYERLLAQGVEFIGTPDEIPNGRYINFRDLYGNVISLYQPRQNVPNIA